MYHTVYYNLCEAGKKQKSLYKQGKSGLHKHHIIPLHSGGEDIESNLTYLTSREHQIAHFLLWKINKNPNDLRSMKMLGVRLTIHQRSIVGRWCFENDIGIYGASEEERAKWRSKGAKTQKKNKIGIHNPENWPQQKSYAGKISIRSPNNPWSYWATAEGRSKRATMGGNSSGKLPATNGHKTKKFHNSQERENFIKENPDWRVGHHWCNKNSIKGKKWITNGEENTFHDPQKDLPEGWQFGRT